MANLHHILTKSTVKSRPSVLWCYKKELGFTSYDHGCNPLAKRSESLFCNRHAQKRMKKIKREIARGQRQPDEEKPFELFVGQTDIRYCYYKESHRVLGQVWRTSVATLLKTLSCLHRRSAYACCKISR